MLIVEDHQVMVEALTGALNAHDAIEIVGAATTLEQAYERVEATKPDVVLLDVHLPDGDGAAGTAEVLLRSSKTSVVILSGLTGIEVIARAVQAGAVGFVAKTEPLDVLTSAIQRAHRGEALFSVKTLGAVAAHLRDTTPRPGRGLTSREREVLELLATGASTDDIAEQLVVSIHTVRNHVRHVMAKLDAHTKLEAVAVALRDRLITLPGVPN